ncbi:MAG: hypothetical protein KDI44_04375 [Thiothrix sp.]|nr:hypothetical protein [Thiothrix sp.]HPQ94433.1 formyltransferase family protein [Thiolinea sp.]
MSRVRVLFCAYPGLYSDQVLAELLKAESIELTGVVCSSRVLSPRHHPFIGSLRQLWHSGLRYAFYLWLTTSGYRLLRRWWYRCDLAQVLHQRGIPQWVTRDVNDAASQVFVAGCRPDVILMAHFNQLLREPLAGLPRLGCWNLHPSLLPDYRGVDPAFHALLAQRQQTGITLHLAAAQFDTGAILEQQPLTIRWHDSLLSLNVKLFHLGAKMALQRLQALVLSGETAWKARPQAEGGRYDSWPVPAQVRQFRRVRQLWYWKEFTVLARQGLGLFEPVRVANRAADTDRTR